MKIRALSIEGAYEITPVVLGDPRGNFAELYKEDVFTAEIGHPLRIAQINTSTSARDVVRGVHWADVPPGQAKYVTCQRGALVDFVIDLRVGSPTFGQWESVLLDAVEKKAVYISEGLGHGFRALQDDTSIHYLCSTPYNPQREYVIHPLDPQLNIDWGVADPVLSARDGNAPSLANVKADGRLPDYKACLAFRDSLKV
ncbi:dTDP-4-dehydrorhamnose 3,5-epimerase family protein [Virgisporangium ochraceum]|uniref:dTDP-4-dehydrorhamnose 3,5-epimerase family protein n=1 Tax=Virgisporangium ochraceum TaxID=65505 RepID=UPI001940DF7D|nr:dTDP-4-dehydrorhamnose 3,5-epimerase family protein [Virgisporangium ochraceum]